MCGGLLMAKRDAYAMVPEDDPQFLRWWNAYPKRVAKKDARKAWARIGPTPLQVDQMIEALTWQRPMWAKDAYRFTPYPASWLNGERWKDEQPPMFKSAAAPWFCPHVERCPHRQACDYATILGRPVRDDLAPAITDAVRDLASRKVLR